VGNRRSDPTLAKAESCDIPVRQMRITTYVVRNLDTWSTVVPHGAGRYTRGVAAAASYNVVEYINVVVAAM